jgi:hypothetical protein
MLLDRVGGLEVLNAWLTSVGFTNTRMVQSTLSFFRQPLELVDPKYRSLPPEDIFAYCGHGVPPPPKYLQEVGRFPRLAEDGSRDDAQRQAPLDQRVSIRSRAPSAS